MLQKKLARFAQKSSENVWKKSQKYFKNYVRILIKKCQNLVTKKWKVHWFPMEKTGVLFVVHFKSFSKMFLILAQVLAKSWRQILPKVHPKSHEIPPLIWAKCWPRSEESWDKIFQKKYTKIQTKPPRVLSKLGTKLAPKCTHHRHRPTCPSFAP